MFLDLVLQALIYVPDHTDDLQTHPVPPRSASVQYCQNSSCKPDVKTQGK